VADTTRGRLSIAARIAYGAIGVVGILALMQLVVASGLVSHRSMPLATEMLHRVGSLMGSGSFLDALGDTLVSTLYAFLLAGAAAAVLGVVIGSERRLDRAMSGLIDFQRPIPSVAWIPVAILLFGLGLQMKVALAAYAAFWPILINTMYGVRDVDPVMLSTGRSFAWGRLKVLRTIIVRASLPFMATGLRIGAAVSLVVVITAELLGAESGVGVEIRSYEAAGRTDFVYGGILVIAIVGLIMNLVLTMTERRVVSWSPEHRR
jgi:NitT/TauT family transport system permease protein